MRTSFDEPEITYYMSILHILEYFAAESLRSRTKLPRTKAMFGMVRYGTVWYGMVLYKCWTGTDGSVGQLPTERPLAGVLV